MRSDDLVRPISGILGDAQAGIFYDERRYAHIGLKQEECDHKRGIKALGSVP